MAMIARIVGIALVVLCCGGIANADSSLGTLRGHIFSSANQRQMLDHANVRLIGLSAQFAAITSSSGEYFFVGIPSGRYVLDVDRARHVAKSVVVCIRAGQDQIKDVGLLTVHADYFGHFPYQPPLNALELQPSATTDMYSLSSCD